MSTYEALLQAVRDNNPKFALRHTKEPEQQFLKRMLNDLADLTDEQFDAMPQEAQDWFNHAVNEELNKHKEVTPPDGFADGPSHDTGVRRTRSKIQSNEGEKPVMAETEQTAQTEQATTTDQVTAEKPTRKRAARVSSNGEVSDEFQRKAPFGGVRGGSRKEFSVRTLRALVIKDPDITVDDLVAKAHDAGEVYSRTTVNLARNQTLEMIRIAKEAGRWQE
jgi:hypothetical protein